MANFFQQQPAQPQTTVAATPNQELAQQIRQNPQAYVAQIKPNPAAFLKSQFGITIPDGMNNPMQIAQYLYGPPPRRGPGRR